MSRVGLNFVSGNNFQNYIPALFTCIASVLGHESIGDSFAHASSNLQMPDNMDNSLLFHNSFSGHEDFSMSIPLDQVQMIQNINSLITEVLGHFYLFFLGAKNRVSNCGSFGCR